MSALSPIERTSLEHDYLREVIQKYTFWKPHSAQAFGFARAFGRNTEPVILPPYFIARRLSLLFSAPFNAAAALEENAAAAGLGAREVLGKYGDYVLIGDVGSGKTALLWHLLYEYALYPQSEAESHLPVGVDLARYDPAASSILEFIRKELLETADIGAAAQPLTAHRELAENLEEYLGGGRLVLLFDSLDGIPRRARGVCLERLAALRDIHPGNRFVFAARSPRFTAALGLPHFVLEDLNSAEQEALLATSFPALVEPPQIDQFEKNEKLAGLKGNALLLLILGAVHEDEGRLAGSPAQLCQAFTESVLARFAPDSAVSRPSVQAQVRALSGLALGIQSEYGSGTWVPRHFAEDCLSRGGQAEQVLAAAELAGLLSESPDGLIGFTHQLFQDYFAAFALKRSTRGSARLREALRDPDSDDALTLMAGLEADASGLVEELIPLDPILAARCAAAARTIRPHVESRVLSLLDGKLAGPFVRERLAAARAFVDLSPETVLHHLLPRLSQAGPFELDRLERILLRAPRKSVVPALVALLDHADAHTRAWAVSMLRQFKAESHLADIMRLEADPVWEVRVEVARMLGDQPGESAAAHLARLLSDPHALVRQAAAEELVEFSPAAAVPGLVSFHPRRWARNRDTNDGNLQAAWLPSLASLLKSNSREERYVAGEMLVRWQGPDPLPHLIRLLNDEDEDMNWLAAQIVGRRKAEAAVPTLLALLAGNSVARTLAAEPLARILGPSAVSHLLPLLGDEDWYVRNTALRTLTALHAPRIVPYIIALLRDVDPDIRALAAACLSELQARAGIPALTCALADEEAKVRAAAARALGVLLEQDAAERLVPLLEDPDVRVRAAAAAALGRQAPVDPHVDQTSPPALDTGLPQGNEWERDVEALRSRDAARRAAAARALALRSGEEDLQLLRPLLHDRDEEVANAAFEIIAAIRGRLALPRQR